MREQQIADEKERQLRENEEKEKRNAEILKKMEDRKKQIQETNELAIKHYKEAKAKKPLFVELDERYQREQVANDLAEQKKQLEIKRSMMNLVPGGQVS
jgi:hypothetical protein